MKIYVGSTNPVKVNAVINAASETWPKVQVKGFSVESGVSEQPMSDEETKQGAINRAKAILQLADEAEIQGEILGIGLEGGVFINEQGMMWSTVWAAVIDLENNLRTANGARFKVPTVVAERIEAGEEMGLIMADLLGDDDIKKKQGMIGVITNGFVDRTEEYTSLVKLALGLWYGQDWLQSYLSVD
jgi:inosine/xanthosine triphosphatase